MFLAQSLCSFEPTEAPEIKLFLGLIFERKNQAKQSASGNNQCLK